jgi:hypothetical protein
MLSTPKTASPSHRNLSTELQRLRRHLATKNNGVSSRKSRCGGCHLNRAIGMLIERAGFPFEQIETGYMRGPRPMTFMYEGSLRSIFRKELFRIW